MKMHLRSPALAAAFALSCCLSIPAAQAQDRLSRTELTAATNSLQTSVEELQTRNSQLQVQNADIALKMRDLEAENAQLNGRIETLQFQLGQSRDEMTRMLSDDQEIGRQLGQYEGLIESLSAQVANLEARLTTREKVYRITEAQLESSGASSALAVTGTARRTASTEGEPVSISVAAANAGAPSTEPGASSNLPSEADPLFQDGKARLLRFDYEGAENSFKAFLQRYPENAQAGEAQYWLGEVLYQQKSYSESGAAYSDMIRNFPTDARAPDALVKLGRSLRLVGDTTRACAVLETLPSRYPDASPVTRNLADVERSRSSCDS